MSNLKFAATHNLVAFLEKPEESDGFVEIIDFMNASSIRYALMIQALVDGKNVIFTEASVRRDLQLIDENGTEFLPNATIFAKLERMGAKTTACSEFSNTMASAIICLATNQKFNFSKYIFDNMVKNLEGGVKFLMYPRFVQVFLDKQVGDMTTHNRTYDAPCHTKKIFANMKREGKGFFRKVTHLFQTMMVQAQEEGADTEDPQLSGPTEPVTDDTENVASVPTHSNDPLLSGEDRLKLNELIELCTKLSKRVLNLENIKTSQDAEITKLKKRVKKLERRNKSRTLGLKKLRKGGRSARIESSKDEGLGDQEDASKQGRKIADLDADVEVTLVDETQGRNDDNLMFDTGVLDEQEVEVEKTLIEIKAAKPKAVTTAATTTTTAVTRPKARGVVVQEPTELEEEEERLARQKEEEANIALIESWDNTQAMMDAYYELASRLLS
ncbi:hypothetical protein Tco_1044666 [Tanacetum coccineum]|uniref:Uncharacterized protein n=1 Tax=Tanacetum coccineum TaxID=301880 RepID=A0ABQ5GQJ5_9ASTR